MNLFEGVARRLGYVKAQVVAQIPAWLGRTAELEQYRGVDGSIYQNQADLYRLSSWVNSAVSRVAQFAAATHLNIYDLSGTRKKEIDNHPFEALLQHPNPVMSRFELLEATFSFFKLNGNGFWWLNKLGAGRPPVEIFCIEPWRMTAVPDGMSAIRGYFYNPGDGQQMLMDASDVVHFKSFNPNSPFVGMSSVEPLAVVTATDLGQQKWNGKMFMKNNGRLPGILAFADPINDTDWAKLKGEAANASEVRELLMLRNAGKGGVQWIQAASTLKDMEFINGRQFTKEEVFTVLAPGLASLLSVNATEANSKAGWDTLTRLGIWPMHVAAGEKITNNILPLYGPKLKAEFEDVRLKDQGIVIQERTLFGMVHTVDEIRDVYDGDDPVGNEKGKMFPAEISGKGGQAGQITPAVPLQVPEGAGGTVDMNQQQVTQGGNGQIGRVKGISPHIPSDGRSGRHEGHEEDEEEEEKSEEGKVELKAWRRKATKAMQAGKSADVPFETEVIPLSECDRIHAGLKAAKTVEEVRKVFEELRIADGGLRNEEGASLAPQPEHLLKDLPGLVKALEDAANALKWRQYP